MAKFQQLALSSVLYKPLPLACTTRPKELQITTLKQGLFQHQPSKSLTGSARDSGLLPDYAEPRVSAKFEDANNPAGWPPPSLARATQNGIERGNPYGEISSFGV